jgi:LysR family transcriptional regulator, transcriptional activator of nhaA
MIPLNYNQLYYFYSIAEAGSISEASKKLLISSPALSMQLKELEEFLQTPLFDRVGKKLKLTESGAIVLEYAKDIFKLGNELRDTIVNQCQTNQRLRIEIGCQDTIPKTIADQLIAFLMETKKCRITLIEGSREELLRLQSTYKLDLILTNSVPAVDNSSLYESRLLLREPLVLLGHPKFKKYKNKLALLMKLPLILPTYESSLRRKIEDFFRDKSMTLDVMAEVEDKATEIDLALKGMGLIFAMKSTVAHLISQKQLVELWPLPKLEEEVWLIIGKRKILNPLALFVMKNFQLSLT